MAIGRDSNDTRAEQRPPHEIEWRARFRLCNFSDCRLVGAAPVIECEWNRRRRVYLLPRLVVSHGKRGTQDLVAGHDVRQRAGQGWAIERTSRMKRHREVIRRVSWMQLLQDPELPL